MLELSIGILDHVWAADFTGFSGSHVASSFWVGRERSRERIFNVLWDVENISLDFGTNDCPGRGCAKRKNTKNKQICQH